MESRDLVLPAYLTASLLVLFPLLDTALSVSPARVGDVAWRFGATGLFSRALPVPFLGILLAFAVALLLGHRRTLRALSILMGLATLVLLGAAMLFLLDAVQMRVQVSSAAKLAFDVASLVALGKIGFGAVITLAFTLVSWKAARRAAAIGRAHAARKGTAGELLLGKSLRPPEPTAAETA